MSEAEIKEISLKLSRTVLGSSDFQTAAAALAEVAMTTSVLTKGQNQESHILTTQPRPRSGELKSTVQSCTSPTFELATASACTATVWHSTTWPLAEQLKLHCTQPLQFLGDTEGLGLTVWAEAQ